MPQALPKLSLLFKQRSEDQTFHVRAHPCCLHNPIHIADSYEQIDTQAPGFYWCTIQACAGIISACLPTMRPLVRGKSFESLIDRMRTKFSNSWPASKLSDYSSHHSSNPKLSDKSSLPTARYNRPSADEYQPPLVHVGKPMGVSHQYDTSVEATQMSSLDHSNMDGILVKSSITNDLSFV